jgi:hypothetical protein
MAWTGCLSTCSRQGSADVEEPRRAFAEDRFMTLLESTTEDLTKAVLTAAGIETPLSFKRLLPEVEREIGRAASDG